MKTICILGSTLAFALATPALAEQVRIKFDDLDLATEHGQNVLDKRIAAAAKEMCGSDEPVMGTRIKQSDARKCQRQFTAKVKKQIAALTEQEARGG